MRNSFNNFCTHIISTVALANALYSASVLDRETVACFLAIQEIRLLPRKTAKPPVDRRSSTHPAQSASENALTSVEFKLDGTAHIPQNSLDSTPMYCGRGMKILTYFVDGKGDIRPGKSEVLQSTNHTSIPC
jgi:hypothetical protein